MRTNYDLVQILKRFNGANDIMIHNAPMYRVNKDLNWTFAGLNIFRNSNLITCILSFKNLGTKNLNNGSSPSLKWAKGDFQSTLSKAMVDYMLKELNVSKFMTQLEGPFAIDEIFIPTLQATEELNIPGGFTHSCIDRELNVDHVTRYRNYINKNAEFGF